MDSTRSLTNRGARRIVVRVRINNLFGATNYRCYYMGTWEKRDVRVLSLKRAQLVRMRKTLILIVNKY